MLKKLLVALLVLTMMFGLFSAALAANPNDDVQLVDKQLTRPAPAQRSTPGCTYGPVWEYYYSSFSATLGVPNAAGRNYLNTRFTNNTPMEVQAFMFTWLDDQWGSSSSVEGTGAIFYIWRSGPLGFPDTLNPVCTSIPLDPLDWAGPYVTRDWDNGFLYVYVDLASLPVPLSPPAFMGDFNVGAWVIPHVTGGKFTFIGDGTTLPGRSSELRHYPLVTDPFTWRTALAQYGTDFSFWIDAVKCATPDPPCEAVPLATDQWPIWCHDFGRSSQSGIQLGTNICGIVNAWVYDVGGTVGNFHSMYNTSPLIYNDKVYVVYNDRVVCLNLLTGLPLWDSKTFTGAFPYNWGGSKVLGSLANPAIVDGYLYMGTGVQVSGGPMGNAGFIKVDATTGALQWGRGADLGANLEGASPPGNNTQVVAPVIIGDKVFFGNQKGVLYALYTATGITAYWTTLPTEGGVAAKMVGSLSSDGYRLFVGTVDDLTYPVAATKGHVYCFVPGASNFGVIGVAPNWTYDQPAAIQLAYPGGFWSAPSYRCGNLFINSTSTYNKVTGTSCGGTGYSGYRQNLDPATGIKKWFADVVMGAAYNAPAATMGSEMGPIAIFANFASDGCGSSNVYSRGIRAVNVLNNTVWSNPGIPGLENQVYCSPTVTSDVAPWVFYGTYDPYGQNALHPYGGNWVITNGTTGTIFAQYALSGGVNGTAIAHGSDGNNYVVVTTKSQMSEVYVAGGTVVGSGLVLAFKVGPDRPRLVVPQTFVEFPSTNDEQAGPSMTVTRKALAAIKNTGCATMTYTATLSDGAVFATVRTVSSSDEERAAYLAASLVDRTVDDLTPARAPLGSKPFASDLVQDERALSDTWVKPAIANSARLGTPTFVTLISPILPIPGPGSADLEFSFDLTKMKKLDANMFYVEISTSDPDYNAEIPPGTPQGVQAEIAYSLPYRYCATKIDSVKFGNTGKAWVNNLSLLGHSDYPNAFDLTGAAADHLFQGTMFYANSMPNAAWNPVSAQGSDLSSGQGYDPFINGSFLYGFPTNWDDQDCGGCVKNTLLDNIWYSTDGLSYGQLHGDVCKFGMIDSGQAAGLIIPSGNNHHGTYQAGGASMGILVQSREITAYGSAFGNFTLTVQTIINRNADRSIAGLYYGSLIDWDVTTNGATDTLTGDADQGYIYNYGTGKAYGQIGLPSKGSYWPDGTPTDPMYNGRLMHSADNIYPNQQFDSLYDWVAKYAEGSMTKKPPVDLSAGDKAYEVAFGKSTLGPNGSLTDRHTFGFATFGIGSGFTGPTQVNGLRNFVNKFAGFGRGDINNDGVINLLDIVLLSRWIHVPAIPGAKGPVPFIHLGNVNGSIDGLVDAADVLYLVNYYFHGGPPPQSTFVF